MGEFQKYLDRMRWDGFRNDSAETVPSFGIMAVTGVTMIGETQKRPVLTIAKPSTTFYRQYVINGPFQVTTGKYGRCARGPGPIWGKHGSGTPANGEGWGPAVGSFTLTKGSLGIFTTNGQVRSSDSICLGTLVDVTSLLVKTTSAITGGSSTTTAYKIYTGTSGSEADSGFTTVPGAISRVDIDSGLWCKLTWINNGWILEPLECNA